MSQVKKHLKVGISLLIAALFALNCARTAKTQFTENMEKDAGKAAPTYDQWVTLIGQQRTDELYAGIGQDSLNLLAYGVGTSNIVQLIDAITTGSGAAATSKFITLVGNDFVAGNGPGSSTGLGSIITVYLLKAVNTQIQANLSTNLVAAAAPSDNQTITNLAGLVNGLSLTEIQTKVVELFGPSGFNLSRNLATTVTGTAGQPALTFTGALQQLVVDRMARLITHVDYNTTTCDKICTVMTGLTNTEVTTKLAPMVTYDTASGMTLANKLVETMQTVTTTTNLITVIQGVTTTNITTKMMPIIGQVDDCTKMGYVINNVTSLTTLINIINNVQVPANMGALLNAAEGGGTWTGQISPTETWGNPTKTAPSVPTFTAANVTVTFNAGGVITGVNVVSGGTGYLPGTAITAVATCGTVPVIRLNIQGGVIQNTGHSVGTNGVGCTVSATHAATITNGTTTAIPRLVSVINGITPASDYYKLLGMVDNITNMTKMVQLVQDVDTITDVTALLNNTTPAFSGAVGTGCAVANGTDTVSGTIGAGLNAVAFNAGGGVSYIRVIAGGTGYTAASTFSVPTCAGVTFTPTISGGVVQKLEVNNSLNNMIALVENMSAANMSRLVHVLNGQRAYNNTGNQIPATTAGTYLNKMTILLNNLSQPLEGPLKVGDLLNGVTNPDKIIDLIYDVATTANLATVINGIFKSTTVPGCSDGSASDADGSSATQASGADYQYNLGAGNTSASDAGTCENSGNGAFWGERDRAVLTLVHLVENVASSAKLVSMIDNITPANVIALVNHVSTYCQHNDADTHVYPRGASGDALNTAALSAGGRRLAKIVDNTTTITQLNFVANNVSSIVKMAKLVSFMDIGAGVNDGVGKLPIVINAVSGTNAYLSTTVPGRGNPTGNATGMGKMVNVIDFIAGTTQSASMVQLKNLMNDVNDINKIADLINQTVNSSNIIGLLNAVVDPRYNPAATTTDLVAFMNSLPRGEISKLVSLIGEIGSASGTATRTFPGPDHVLMAQLMSPFAQINSQATVTMTIATPAVVTWTGHGFAADQSITFATTGALPTGVTAGQTYFVSATGLTANTFQISLTKGGTSVNTSGTQSGTHTGNAYSPTATSGLGVADMNALVGSLNQTGGTGYTTSFTLSGATMNAGGGTGASANSIVYSAANTLTKVTVTAGGTFPTVPTAVTIGGTCPSATAQVVGSRIDGGANFMVTGIYVTNGGTGGCTAPTFSYTPAPSVAPTVTTESGGLIGFSVTAGGTGYTDSFTISGGPMIAGGGTGASAKALVAGPLNTTTGLTNFNGGAGYVNGQVCSVIGAGGSGGTCTVQVTAGAVTGCSAITGGTGYIDDQVVTIGGAATARATVDGTGTVTGFTIENRGCGYAGPTVSVRLLSGTNECTSAGSYTGNIVAGRLDTITINTAGTGCPANPTVIVGDSPYATHGDNATAVVNAVVGGTVVALSISTPADNLAQLLTNTEKAPLNHAVTYASNTPNISAREGMVRLLKQGVTYSSVGGWAANYFNFTGVGPVYIGRNILGNLTGANSTMTVINLLGSDTTGLQEFPVLMGCGDRIQYGTTIANSFYTGCFTHSPTLW